MFAVLCRRQQCARTLWQQCWGTSPSHRRATIASSSCRKNSTRTSAGQSSHYLSSLHGMECMLLFHQLLLCDVILRWQQGRQPKHQLCVKNVVKKVSHFIVIQLLTLLSMQKEEPCGNWHPWPGHHFRSFHIHSQTSWRHQLQTPQPDQRVHCHWAHEPLQGEHLTGSTLVW